MSVDRLSSSCVYSHRFVSVHEHRVAYPGAAPFDVVTLELCDWVSIAAFTSSGDVILVRQHRHGVNTSTLETPGGIIDPGETPVHAAIRELLEETGYRARSAHSLGWVHPNPALSSNRCHMFRATDVECVREPLKGDDERTEVAAMPQSEILRAIQDGRITHALAVIALERAVRTETR